MARLAAHADAAHALLNTTKFLKQLHAITRLLWFALIVALLQSLTLAVLIFGSGAVVAAGGVPLAVGTIVIGLVRCTKTRPGRLDLLGAWSS